MEIEIFTLSDSAHNYNDRLVISGTFDAVASPMFPFMHPHCSIALRLRFGDKEMGKHKIELKFLGPKGEVHQPITAKVDVNKRHPSAQYAAINFVMNMANLKFDLPGQYSFELHVDDEWRSGLPLNVLEVNKNVQAA